MDPINDIDLICPCHIVIATGETYRCDMPISLNGPVGNEYYTFISGTESKTVKWNIIRSFINIEDPQKRINC